MKRPIRVLYSDLTGSAYAVTRYEFGPREGDIIASKKEDVTDDVVHHLMATAWARGWNEALAAPDGDPPPNPYRPQGETHS